MEKFLKETLKEIKPNANELKQINKETVGIVKALQAKIKKAKLSADVFVGGSVAKDTLIKKDKYDIDIFVRFNTKYDQTKISDIL
jgi:tRNA nucleotidyltransferase (CCA-adding enzyme)